MQPAQVLKIVLACLVIYIIIAPPIAVFVGRKLHNMAQAYPPVEENECPS